MKPALGPAIAAAVMQEQQRRAEGGRQRIGRGGGNLRRVEPGIDAAAGRVAQDHRM